MSTETKQETALVVFRAACRPGDDPEVGYEETHRVVVPVTIVDHELGTDPAEAEALLEAAKDLSAAFTERSRDALDGNLAIMATATKVYSDILQGLLGFELTDGAVYNHRYINDDGVIFKHTVHVEEAGL